MNKMLCDIYGAPISCEQNALSGINDFVEGFVGYQKRSVNVIKTAEQNPDCALANIYAGILWMFLERPEAPAKAQPFLDRAMAATKLNERELGLRTLLSAWHQYDIAKTIKVAEDLLNAYPQDLSTLKIAQYHLFNSADATGMLRVAQSCLKANQNRAPVHSMIAFGHEQANEIELARASALNALEIDPNEPWAHHALSHIHLSNGAIKEGRQFLQGVSDSWSELNSFMYTHNWWHMALFHLADGEAEQALSIYDGRCWGVQPEYSQDQIGAISLLARLEIAGVDVGERWQALQPYLVSRIEDVQQPFLTLQYLYGLARLNINEADQLMNNIELQASSPAVPQDQALWKQVAIPAAKGVYAHAKADWPLSAKCLGDVRRTLWQVGGSHAQRDLFDQLLLDARIKCGEWDKAKTMITQRQKYEPDNPLLHSWMGVINE